MAMLPDATLLSLSFGAQTALTASVYGVSTTMMTGNLGKLGRPGKPALAVRTPPTQV